MRNFFNGQSIRFKISLAALLVLGLFTAVIVSYTLLVIRPQMVSDRENTLAAQLDNIANDLNSFSRERQNLAVGLARRGEFLFSVVRSEDYSFNSKQEQENFIGKFLAREVESFPFIVGAGLFYEPFALDKNEKFRGFYARWVPPMGMSRKVEFTMSRSTPQADYQNSNWYRTLIPNGWDTRRHLYTDSTWTEPYRDPVTLVPMLSVLVAMYSEDSALLGLSSVDWNLDQLTESIDQSRPTKNSIAALFSPSTKKFAAVAGLQGLNLEPIDKAPWTSLLLFNAPRERYEMVKARNDENKAFRVYSRALENNLIYSIVIPEEEIFAAIYDADAQMAALLAILLIVSMLATVLYAKRYLAPLAPLSRIANRCASGDFSEAILVQSGDEIQTLSEGIQHFGQYVNALEEAHLQLTHGQALPMPAHPPAQDKAGQSLYSLTALLTEFAQEIEAVESRIQGGEISARLDVSKFTGSWKNSAKQINNLIEMFEKLIAESTAVCNAACQGDFSARFLDSRPGVFEEFRQAFNGAFETHRRLWKQAVLNLESTEMARNEAMLASKAKGQLLAQACDETQRTVKDILRRLPVFHTSDKEPGKQEAYKSIKGSCGTILGLADELIGYIQLDEGKIEVSRSRFNLHRMLFDLKDTLRPQLVKRHQEFSLVIAESVPEFVIGDCALLLNTLLGLGSQSIRYTELEGSITLSIDVIESTEETHTLRFNISDSGGGFFSAKRIEAVSNLNSGNSENVISGFGGGLGLVIAKRVCELMGGTLSLASHVGVGVRYEIIVPLLNIDTDRSGEIPRNEDPLLVSDRKVPHVLVVEDDIINQKVACQLLKRHGCNPIAVQDGLDALKLIGQQKFDLIVMDINLPNLDGVETTRRIRSSGESYANIPIVALTANPLKLGDETQPAEGFNNFLLKPLEGAALKEILKTLRLTEEASEQDINEAINNKLSS